MTVYYANQETYQIESIKLTLEKALQGWGGIEGLLKGKQKILLKPNLIKPYPVEAGVTTNPQFIVAIAELLLDHGVKVSVADSPALGSVEECMKMLKLDGELKKRGIPYFTFKKAQYFKGSSLTYPILGVAREIFEFDGLINLPKLKTHCQTGFTGAVKNLYGCVPGKRKVVRHVISGNSIHSFLKMILRNAEIVAPLLTIADGIHALHKNGPTRGEIYPLHSILISDNCLELDWAFCRLIGMSPENTPLFQASCKTFDQLEIQGDPWEVHKDFIHAKRMPIVFYPIRIFKLLSRR